MREPLITWKDIHQKFPWDVLFLLGGGYAMSAGVVASGLSSWIGTQLHAFNNVSPTVLVLLSILISSTMTEVVSNTATANIILPVLMELSRAVKINPVYLAIPAINACSFAFMLPVGTPPNALMFAVADIKRSSMAIAGLGVKVICILVLMLFVETWGQVVFHFKSIPDWALENRTTNGTGPTVMALPHPAYLSHPM